MNLNLSTQILELRAKGYSYNQIKNELNCSLATVSYWCNPNVRKTKKKLGQKHRASISKKNRARRQEKRMRLVQDFGGKCSICGYNKCIDALQFHHLDSNNKEYDVSRLVTQNRPYEKILKEAKKCIMICANCHAEIHAKAHEESLSG